MRSTSSRIQEIIDFLKKTYKAQEKARGVIAVSGGIDSASSLTLLTKALGAENVYPIFLPYKNQSTNLAKLAAEFNKIPEENWQEVNIAPMVEQFVEVLQIEDSEKIRLGNIMARCRMIVIYDLAKQLDALICGTENKSEKYLGYFTRFGDEASDIEPIVGLFKTEVRQLARELAIPREILEAEPSAGLWEGQTDEGELGFSYEEADKVLEELARQKEGIVISTEVQRSKRNGEISLDDAKKDLSTSPASPAGRLEMTSTDEMTRRAVIKRVEETEYKHEVPYTLDIG